MIDLNDTSLMMIEPSASTREAADDEWTVGADRLMAACTPSKQRYRGFHTCACGELSDNREWTTPQGRLTNSLLPHYVRMHRDEIPVGEMEKLDEEIRMLP